MNDMRDKTTRRQFLGGAAALLAGGMAGCTADADDALNDMSVYKHDSLPSLERNWSEELEMGLSGARLYTREGAEADRVDIARYSPGNGPDGGDWFLDVVDLLLYGRDDDEPESWVKAEDLAEGSTVVFLAAYNERFNEHGRLLSPDCERNPELRALLDD